MAENFLKIKATANDPFFGSEKWNISVEQIKTLENIFNSINKKFLGIFNENINYKEGNYVFFEDICYEMTSDSSEHFKVMKPKDYYYLNSSRKLSKNNVSLNEKSFDFIVFSNETKEVLCVENNKLFIWDNSLKALSMNNLERINSATFDEYSIYFSTGRKIIKKERNTNSLSETIIFQSNLLIKNITLNNNFIFAILSDNSIAKINRSNNQNEGIYNPRLTFSNDIKCISTNQNNLFIVDNSKLYTFFIEDNLTLVSDFSNSLLKQRPISISKYGKYLYIEYSNNEVISFKPSLLAMKPVDFSKLIISNSNVISKDIVSFIKPKENIISSKELDLNLNNYLLIKNKGLEINNERTLFNLNLSLTNKSILIISENENGEEKYSIRINRNKLLEFSISQIGQKKIFINIFDNYADIYIYNQENLIKNKINIINFISINQTLEMYSTTNFYLEELYIFNRNLEKVEMDFYAINQISTQSLSNNKDFLPYSFVECDSLGNPKLKFSDGTIVNDDNGIKANSSNEYKASLKNDDTSLLFTVAGAKEMFREMNQNSINNGNEKANRNHTHDWSNIENVPTASSEVKGIVLLNDDPTETTTQKAATPFMVNEVKKIINQEIKEGVSTKVKEIERNLNNLNNSLIPGINTSIADLVNSINEKIEEIDEVIGSPNSYLDKKIGGEVIADLSIQNIDFSNNVIKFKKDVDTSAGIYFGEYAHIKHENGESGINTFKIASSIYQNDTSGGIDIGYIQNKSFYKTAFISSSGNSSFNLVNSSTDVNVGRDIKLVGDLYITSDRRLKREIKNVENALNKINQINGCTFYKIGFPNKTAGIIAQEVQKVFPELVIEEKNNLEVNYNGLHALTIEAIKELIKENKILKNEIENLKSKIK